MKRKAASRGGISGVFVFVLMGIFALVSTLMVLFGARAYRNITQRADENNAARVLSAFVRSSLVGEDEAGRLELREEGGVQTLCFLSSDSGDDAGGEIEFEDDFWEDTGDDTGDDFEEDTEAAIDSAAGVDAEEATEESAAAGMNAGDEPQTAPEDSADPTEDDPLDDTTEESGEEDFWGDDGDEWEEPDRFIKRLYCYDGWLREQYTFEENEFDPEDGETLCAAQSMTAQVKDGLLTVILTDTAGVEQSVQFAMRTPQMWAAAAEQAEAGTPVTGD